MNPTTMPIRLNPCRNLIFKSLNHNLYIETNIENCSPTTAKCEAKLKKIPGDRASYVKDCYSKQIDDDGYCKGRVLGEACNLSQAAFCEVGLYCAPDSTCKPVKTEGEPCSALNECATYLICNMGAPMQVCTMPYSLKPLTFGHFTGIPQLCSTGWLNSAVAMCKPPAEFAPGIQLVNPILFDKENLCNYTDGTSLDGSCMYFSKSPMATVICQPYNQTYMDKLKDLNAYLQEKPQCAENLFNVFCDKAIDRIDPCKTRKALEAMLYTQLIIESYYPDCWEKTYTLTAEMFACSAINVHAGLIGIFVTLILALLI